MRRKELRQLERQLEILDRLVPPATKALSAPLVIRAPPALLVPLVPPDLLDLSVPLVTLVPPDLRASAVLLVPLALLV